MKHILIISLILTISLPVWAQEELQIEPEGISTWYTEEIFLPTEEIPAEDEAEMLIKQLDEDIEDLINLFTKKSEPSLLPEPFPEETPIISRAPEKEEQVIPAPLEEEKIPLRLKNRRFEISLLNTSVGFNNSFLAAKDIFQETMVINLDDLSRGFQTEFGLNLTPIAININAKDKWGFGFDIGNVTAFGNVDIADKLLTFQQTDRTKFGAGGAAFVDVGLPIFFHVRKLKIKLRPSAYLPIAYAEPNITYSFTEKGNLFKLMINYDMYVYAPLSLEEIIDEGSLDINSLLSLLNTTTLGFDMNAGFEFPINSWLDAGVNLTNIPLSSSLVNHYMRLTGEAFLDASVFDIQSLILGGDMPEDYFGFPDDFTPSYGTGEKSIPRPFKFVTYAVYRPLKTPLISLIPNLGLAFSSLYAQPVSLEAGLKFKLDLANMFVTTVGVNYEDRAWRNSINFAINLRLLEIYFGVITGSQSFVKSFQGAGLGANVGLKFGW